MVKQYNYKKKLVLLFPQRSVSEQQPQPQLEELDNNINKRSSNIFVLFAKSVSVAEAIIPISKTSKISLEKFIPSSYILKFDKKI